MHQTDSGRFWIDNVNGATVSNVNAKGNAALVGDNTVAAGEFAAHRAAATALNNSNFVSVNLFGGEQRPIRHADCVANFTVRGIEPHQYFGFVMRDVDSRNSMRENVAADSDCAQRGKFLKGQIHELSSRIQAPRPKTQNVILSGAKDL